MCVRGWKSRGRGERERKREKRKREKGGIEEMGDCTEGMTHKSFHHSSCSSCYSGFSISSLQSKCSKGIIPIKFVAADVGFFPPGPATFFAAISRLSISALWISFLVLKYPYTPSNSFLTAAAAVAAGAPKREKEKVISQHTTQIGVQNKKGANKREM